MREITLLRVAVVVLALAALATSQTNSNAVPQASTAPDPHAVPVLDGGIGPCSADFTITSDAAGTPVYAATIKVHIAYGFFSVRKLDLQLSTNIDGKARFTGLPDKIKHGIYFEASQGDRNGEAFDDPANTCKSQFTIVLEKK